MSYPRPIKCTRCNKWTQSYMTYTKDELKEYICYKGNCFEKGNELFEREEKQKIRAKEIALAGKKTRGIK